MDCTILRSPKLKRFNTFKSFKSGSVVKNTDTEQYDTFTLIDEEQTELSETEANEIIDIQDDDINYWIYIKDKFNISNDAWHEMALRSKQYQILTR